jgi:hypothetical protein
MRRRFCTLDSQLICALTKSSSLSTLPFQCTFLGSFLELMASRMPLCRSAFNVAWRSAKCVTAPSPMTPAHSVLSRSQTSTFFFA